MSYFIFFSQKAQYSEKMTVATNTSIDAKLQSHKGTESADGVKRKE